MNQTGSIKTVYHFITGRWAGWHWRLGRVMFDLGCFEHGGEHIT
jgi:hypothetical protein